MTAIVPVDWQLTDTYFVVAHLHYVLLGINVFPVIGGIYFWFPKFSGRMMNECLGKWNFWTLFIGFILAFFPMHITGMLGMPRRVYTYPAGMGWDLPNLITSVGAFVFALGVLMFLWNIVFSLKRGKEAGPNPWDALSLEWLTPSPPPSFNFVTIPNIASRHPLWEDRLSEGQERSELRKGMLLDHGREIIGTSAVDAKPEAILRMPGDTSLPLLYTIALTVLFTALLLDWWWTAGLASVAILILTITWLWPRQSLGQVAEASHG